MNIVYKRDNKVNKYDKVIVNKHNLVIKHQCVNRINKINKK